MTMKKNAALALAAGTLVAVTLAVQAVAHSAPAEHPSWDVGLVAHASDGGVSAVAPRVERDGGAPMATPWDVAAPSTMAHDSGVPTAIAHDASPLSTATDGGSPVTLAWDSGSPSMP